MNIRSRLVAMALATAVSFIGSVVSAQSVHQQVQQQPRKCHWWQFGHCDPREAEVEGLPDGAPRIGTLITIDLSTNYAYLFQDGKLVAKSKAATGSGKTLIMGDDEWAFHTPQGRMKVLRKVVDPIWRKPDWAFIEEGDPIPAPDSPKRLVRGHLGKYALDLGDGIMIHGTDDPRSIGRKVSHGCIRLPNGMLAKVYKAAKVGTEVFVFQSVEPVLDASK